MVLLKFKGLSGGDYYIRSDAINYYGYNKTENYTSISSNGVWFYVNGDVTKEITAELNKLETAKIIKIGE